MLDKTIKSKEFKAIDGSIVIVEIFVKRITVKSNIFSMQYSCYDFCSLNEWHKNIISNEELEKMHKFVLDKCTYLKPKEEQKFEGDQFSLF